MDVSTILIAVLGLLILAFAGRQIYLRWRVTSISVDAAAERIRNNGNVTVLDVREPAEYEAGHIRGSILLPQGEVGNRAEEILARDDDVIVVCASGNRSLSAANRLMGKGFENVVNMQGGMNAWQQAGLPVDRGTAKTSRRKRG